MGYGSKEFQRAEPHRGAAAGAGGDAGGLTPGPTLAVGVKSCV
jgi:hypothetical protein